jgi:LAO/AO transport system kinase
MIISIGKRQNKKRPAVRKLEFHSQKFLAVCCKKHSKIQKIQPSSEELVHAILLGNITALSRAITLVESTNTTHLVRANAVIKACLPHANKSIRIEITGVQALEKVRSLSIWKHLTGLGKEEWL